MNATAGLDGSTIAGIQAAPQSDSLEDFGGTSFPFDVVEAPWSLAEWLPLLTMIVLTAVLLPAVVRFLRRDNRVEKEAVVEPGEEFDPRAEMNLRLQALQQLPSSDADLCCQFFEQAAEALRCYLIEQWQFPADRQTSEESLLAWKQTELEEESLRTLLNLCDGTKFAKRRANAEDVEQWLQQCRRFVEVGR